MGHMTPLTILHRRALNQILLYTSSCPSQAMLEPRIYLRALRAALRMSQRHLSRRSGVSQARIARIEAGFGGVQLATIKRLYSAMFCDLLVLPLARKRPSDALAERELERTVGKGPWDDAPPDAKQEKAAARLYW